jgi:hypothetical protein
MPLAASGCYHAPAMKLLKLLALTACFSLVACSHAGPQTGTTAKNLSQNPLPDGKYCIPSAPRGIATLEVNAGDKVLLGPGKERVAVKSFSEDATGHQRFFHVGFRRFLEGLRDVPSEQMPMMLSAILADYNLPRMACPALEDIMARNLDRKKPEPQESEE